MLVFVCAHVLLTGLTPVYGGTVSYQCPLNLSEWGILFLVRIPLAYMKLHFRAISSEPVNRF